jgi:hypothetical protein
MRTVLFAAASTLCVVFAAHGAEQAGAGQADASQQVAPNGASEAIPSVGAPAGSCIDTGASLSKAAYSTDDDAECCSGTQYCSQYLSTQMLVQAPLTGHT